MKILKLMPLLFEINMSRTKLYRVNKTSNIKQKEIKIKLHISST